jgi:hypothetical protein
MSIGEVKMSDTVDMCVRIARKKDGAKEWQLKADFSHGVPDDKKAQFEKDLCDLAKKYNLKVVGDLTCKP